jgi:NADH-quinone oxidoreductase subunit M
MVATTRNFTVSWRRRHRHTAGLASSILLFAGIFVSWHIKDRAKEFYIWILILAAATIGVFMSLDLFFLYFFYEMSVIPMYLLLGMWGSHTKKYLEMTDPEGVKQRDSVGFIFNFGSNSKEYAAMKLVLSLRLCRRRLHGHSPDL